MNKKTITGVSLHDLQEGELFSFGYDLDTTYRLMGFKEDGNAIVRKQSAGAEDENANPYYHDIVRK